MKDHVRQSFRWAAHTLGMANVKPRDFIEQEGEIEAGSPYTAWMLWKDTEHPLEVGDLLQSDSGTLYLYKYVGFEEARWVVPEAKPDSPTVPGEEAVPAGSVTA